MYYYKGLKPCNSTIEILLMSLIIRSMRPMYFVDAFPVNYQYPNCSPNWWHFLIQI